ncbi:hypothetical protein JCM9533A_86840 [Catenuloplanes niger JCM 9533]
MVTQVVVHGRPADIRAAAAAWEIALYGLNSVKTSLDRNVTDLGATWKGEAYEAFRTHIESISENIRTVYDEANSLNTVVGTLNESAARLEAAQAEIPIPAGMEDEVAAARNEDQGIPDGVFETAAVGLLGLPLGPIGVVAATGAGALLSATGAFDALSDWLNDRTDEARAIWNRVNFEIEGQVAVTPGGTAVDNAKRNPVAQLPVLDVSGPGGGISALSGGGGVAGATPALSAEPTEIGSVAPPGTGTFDPATAGAPSAGTAGAAPALGSGTAGFDPDAVAPGTASFDPAALGTGSLNPGSLGAQPPTGTGLAGAGGGLGAGGLGAGGLGAGGLGAGGLGAGGLGAGGLGAGGLGTGALGAGGIGSPGGSAAGAGGLGGALVGGGALGKPVSPAQAGIPGVGALGAGPLGAAAGRNAGRGGGAGAAGKPTLPGNVAGAAAGGRPGALGPAGIGGVGAAGQGAGFDDDSEHTTWLTEDDDVWGGNETAAPGVLR